MTALEDSIRDAEQRVLARWGLRVDQRFVALSGCRLRVLTCGSGRPVVLLHGVNESSMVWAPLLSALHGYSLLAVDLPGHGLSGPVTYRAGRVRSHTLRVMDDLWRALDLDRPVVIGHSLGGMYALWYAAARPSAVASLIAVGGPAVAFPGVQVKMPMPLLGIPKLGELVLRIPSSTTGHRRMLAQVLGGAAGDHLPDELVDALRFAQARPGNARTVNRLISSLTRFGAPRPEAVMSDADLKSVAAPALFVWGSDDPFQSPESGRQSVDKLPSGSLREVAGGHAPWLEDVGECASAIARHLAEIGYEASKADGASQTAQG